MLFRSYELGVLVAAWLVRNKPAAPEEEEYKPMSIEDMDKEFDRIEDENKA